MSKVTKINNKTRAVAVACSDDEKRYVLQGVLVTKDEIVATNGQLLFHTKKQVEDFDEVPANITADRKLPEEDLIIPKTVIDKAVKQIPKKAILEVLKSAYLMKNEISSTDTTSPLEFKPIDGIFPKWKQVIPVKDPDDTKVALSVLNLKKLLDAAKMVKAEVIEITVKDGLSPIVADIKCKDEEDIHCVIMSMRLK